MTEKSLFKELRLAAAGKKDREIFHAIMIAPAAFYCQGIDQFEDRVVPDFITDPIFFLPDNQPLMAEAKSLSRVQSGRGRRVFIARLLFLPLITEPDDPRDIWPVVSCKYLLSGKNAQKMWAACVGDPPLPPHPPLHRRMLRHLDRENPNYR